MFHHHLPKRTGTNKLKIMNKEYLKIKKPRMPNNIDVDSQDEESFLLFTIQIFSFKLISKFHLIFIKINSFCQASKTDVITLQLNFFNKKIGSAYGAFNIGTGM